MSQFAPTPTHGAAYAVAIETAGGLTEIGGCDTQEKLDAIVAKLMALQVWARNQNDGRLLMAYVWGIDHVVNDAKARLSIHQNAKAVQAALQGLPRPPAPPEPARAPDRVIPAGWPLIRPGMTLSGMTYSGDERIISTTSVKEVEDLVPPTVEIEDLMPEIMAAEGAELDEWANEFDVTPRVMPREVTLRMPDGRLTCHLEPKETDDAFRARILKAMATQPEISDGIDEAIKDELDHPPKPIMREE